MDSTWTSLTFMCKGSKSMIFHSNGDWGSTFFALVRLSPSLSFSLSLSLSLSFSLSLRGGLWLIPSEICGMEDPAEGMVNRFRLQMVVTCRSCCYTRTRS